MSERDDGGPAFPAKRLDRIQALDPKIPDNYAEGLYPGMSLRDYMAVHAPAHVSEKALEVGFDAPEAAYLWADALLAAREK